MALVEVTRHGKVAVVRLNRPERANALNAPMAREWLAAMDEVEEDSGTRIVVLTAAGNNFCAGADIGEVPAGWSQPASGGLFDDSPQMHVVRRLLTARKPVIAAVQGPALGAGVAIVAAAHLAMASDRATFGLPEMNIGLFPAAIFGLLARQMGLKKAFEISMNPDPINASEALRLGLVNQVVAHGELQETVMGMAQRYSEFYPEALSAASRIYARHTQWSGAIAALPDFTDLWRWNLPNFFAPGAIEGFKAYQEKRVPRWDEEG